MRERLQKILSARGIASRRKAEEYILKGLVKVNGGVAVLGQKADTECDVIEVDGTVLRERQEMLYYVMHKPIGVITSNVPGATGAGRDQKTDCREQKKQRGSSRVSTRSTRPENLFPTVRDLLPEQLKGKIFPVGRLDKESSGLLLLTNDGVLAYRLTHPKFDHEKEYDVQLDRPISDDALDKMRAGMVILGERTKPATVRRVSPDKFRIVLTEGKNRQIRRICEKVGCRVLALSRMRIVTLEDPGLRPGAVRCLAHDEIDALLQAMHIEHPGEIL